MGLLRGKLSDEKEKAFQAAWIDPWAVRLCWVGGWSGGVRARLVRARLLLTVEQKQQTGASGVFALGGMPQAEIADLMQALGQDVLEGSGA